MRFPEAGALFQSKYRIEEVLGSGGFATVFRATDTAADRVVAIKVLKPELTGYPPDVESRFHREVRILANLRDEHTLTMFDYGRAPDGLLYMVTEYVPGEDLLALLERRGRLEPPEVVHIVRQVLMSLREAHANGLLHRDIKPANIRVFSWMGDPLRVKLLDFGIAKPAREVGADGITRDGEIVGTPKYMSPEQLLSGELSAATDVYSLGVVAFEMLMGSAQMHGNQLHDQLQRLATGHVFSIPEINRIGAGFARIIDRMSARETDNRFRTADEALAALNAFSPPQRSGSHSVDSGLHFQRGSDELLPPPTHANYTPGGLLPPSGTHPRTGSFDEFARPIPPTDPGFIAPKEKGNFGILAIAAGLVVAVVCVGVVAAGVATKEEPVKTPIEPAMRNNQLVKSAEPSEPAEPTLLVENGEPDAGLDLGVAGPSFGCGIRQRSGFGAPRAADGFSASEWPWYIPRDYDPSKPHALIVLMHENAEDPDTFLRHSRLDEIADREGVVLVAPRGNFPYAWEIMDHGVAAMQRAVSEAKSSLCIDPDRVFGVGHAAGGRVVERGACKADLFRAIATTSFRGTPGDLRALCAPKNPVPYIQLAPMHDKYNPVKGGKSCSGAIKVSLTKKEAAWRKFHKCGSKKSTWFEDDSTRCEAWSCEVPLVTCHLDGGRSWAGQPPPWNDFARPCKAKTSKFAYAAKIWDFFVQNSTD